MVMVTVNIRSHTTCNIDLFTKENRNGPVRGVASTRLFQGHVVVVGGTGPRPDRPRHITRPLLFDE